MNVTPFRPEAATHAALIYTAQAEAETLLLWASDGHGDLIARFAYPDMAEVAGRAIAISYSAGFRGDQGGGRP